MDSQQLDSILWRHLSALPYFRGFLRAVEDRFYQDIDLPEPVLDIGSGDGHFASVAFEKKLDVGLDPWAAPMKEAKARDSYRLLVLAEGAQIPFPEAHFSSVVSTSVLEHIPDIQAVINDISRVIKPGGKFVFCVPNHRFPLKLWGKLFLHKLGLRSLGESYSRLFNRIARHAHTDAPEIWVNRLNLAGFEVEDTWDYFSPKMLHILEWGHPLGLPYWVSKKLFGKWVLFPNRFFLAFPWATTRKYMNSPKSAEGVCSFFIARRMS